eukprot:CAMPEP_0119504892 /NCGR_PEP_ID=MMETSP1344-20130328/25603_1 /TAXON_ID=236787 /ORGANISM="Florenciella parvula, Strain CCMP2471" /LENGTH=145 /DNA_ID=CAMNT_0007541305 /DNA_START=82 /DNA_END=520 /DNA_ORIENTATION=-
MEGSVYRKLPRQIPSTNVGKRKTESLLGRVVATTDGRWSMPAIMRSDGGPPLAAAVPVRKQQHESQWILGRVDVARWSAREVKLACRSARKETSHRTDVAAREVLLNHEVKVTPVCIPLVTHELNLALLVPVGRLNRRARTLVEI